MKLQTYKHEDNRRTLVEWIDNIPVKCVKTIFVKEKIPLGNHYHNNKDEIFYLLKGKGVCTLKTRAVKPKITRDWMFEGDCILVPRGVIHRFELFPDSILLEAATEPYNHEDEIQVFE